ncbi:malto-oligosyltrehalose trehalohydrolase [Inquilinus limosus]|uniref:malto-oligosyltrehalose trehalohydrolase n=1 Tax=Inquilinus limosus TaxID=171674 RepID=UPI003F16DA48
MNKTWGPTPVALGRARFALWAPDRRAVSLETRDGPLIEMAAEDDGWFVVEADAGPGTVYRFRLEDDLAVPDPASRAVTGGVSGWSVVVDEESYAWRTADWRGRPWHESVIQELHVGLLGGFAGVAKRLDSIAALGITAIELMPIHAFPGARNWGYDGVLPYAPEESYGSPDELKALIDRAHQLSLMVFLDVVYNHFGPEGNYIGQYASSFFRKDAETPWGGAVAVDREPVRRFFFDNALMWLRDYRVDGLRFDAVHAIENDEFLDALAHEVRQTLGPERHIHLILENENNDSDRIGPGRYDAQWNDDFHNTMHVLLTGETDAYYRDFADRPAPKLARSLAEGFVYQGHGSLNRGGRPRGKPSDHLPPTAFVSFLQNHDQVGNRALGERLTLLTSETKLRAATALLLLSPQVPLIFMGDESGSESPFLFFTDYRGELAEAVCEGRRREFVSFPAFANPETRMRIPDPNAKSTFDRSKPLPGPNAASWLDLYRRLLAIRRTKITPHLVGARSKGTDAVGDAAVLARWQLGNGTVLSIAVNFGDDPVTFPPVHGTVIYAESLAGSPDSVVAWLASP